MKKIIVSISTIQKRKEGLKKVLKKLLPQSNKIYVWLDDYKGNIPDDLLNKFPSVHFYSPEKQIGANGKFHNLQFIKDEEYYFFTCDDDIIYPLDYIDKNIEVYESNTIQSSHGGFYKQFPIKESWSAECNALYFGGFINKKYRVHWGGTGVMMMDFNVTRILNYKKFDIPDHKNMVDQWIGGWSYQNNIPIYTIPHNSGWLKQDSIIENNQGINIWKIKNDKYYRRRARINNLLNIYYKGWESWK